MEILPQVQEALNYIQSIDVSHIENNLQAGRAFYEKFIPLAGEEEAVWKVENIKTSTNTTNTPNTTTATNTSKTSNTPTTPTTTSRIYRPSETKSLPAVIYFHGGWFTAGSLDTHDRPLRQLANQSGAIIISVDYRLAPEYPFPHGLNDCINTTRWIMEHATALGIDPHRIAVAGDSAGGALATAVAGEFPNLKCQVLIYPVTDSSLSTPSWQEFAEGPNLTLAGAIEAWGYYATDQSPISNNNLSHMPDAFIITAEYDPLRDEAIAYAEKLRQAHIQVTEKLYPKMIHGFFQMGGVIDEGRDAIKEIAAYLRYKFSF